MVFSHSRVECFEQCPRKYKYRYIDRIKTIPSDDPADPLRLGTALHRGIETDAATAIHEYLMSYPVITDDQINEAIKLEAMIEKCRAILPEGGHEIAIHGRRFIGFLDLLVPVGDHEFDLYDFKYSNSDRYANSRQLHEYKHFFEAENPPNKIRKMCFVMVPKVAIKPRSGEDLFRFRRRITDDLSRANPELMWIDYDPAKVFDYYDLTQDIMFETEFGKKETSLCRFCEYNPFCLKGEDFMNLPTIDRRSIGETQKRKIWIYGAPFSGKTSMLDKAPNPLNLNTDGNIKFVTMPYVGIKDVVTVEGRQTKRVFAWEIFKDTVAELEKKQNDFKTIVIDLVEDTREMCRLFKYDELGIQHESDSGYGKGWDIIKTEYLSTLRRFFNLDYDNLVIVSHEVSSEVKKKNGQTITKISPNLSENIASKIAGMVDIVARVVVEDDGARTLNFKSNEYIFGGGRLTNMTETTIPLDWNELIRVYDESEGARNAPSAKDGKEDHAPAETPAQTRTAGRRSRQTEDPAPTETPSVVDAPEQPTPTPEIPSDPAPVAEDPTVAIEPPRRRARKIRE